MSRLETSVRPAICDSLSLATVVLLKALGASALESQNRIRPDPGLISGLIYFEFLSDQLAVMLVTGEIATTVLMRSVPVATGSNDY